MIRLEKESTAKYLQNCYRLRKSNYDKSTIKYVHHIIARSLISQKLKKERKNKINHH